MIRYSDRSREINFILDTHEDLIFNSAILRVKIILSNLISNAIQYHDNNKKERFIKVSADSDKEAYYLQVEDNGSGIPKEHLDSIFKMFYKVTKTTKGSGLGLYIVQDAVNTLGGKITAESILREGTTFKIQLPSNHS